MNIAILFNSEDPKYNHVWGWAIRDQILSTGVLQSSNRHLKVSVGDVIVNSQNPIEEKSYRELLFYKTLWNRLFTEKIEAIHVDWVFAWVIQNATEEIALKLHAALQSDSAYLGIHSVDFSYLFHLAIYRNIMISKYRIKGNTCRIFYSMSNEDEKAVSEQKELLNLGFSDVDFENTGAHKTVFDDFDTEAHFKKIAEFEDAISVHLTGGKDEAGEITMLIQDLNPKLFNTLGALVRTLNRAENEEDFAQVGVSSRRYLEQLADVLFPAQDAPYKGRNVKADKYKNRLWAYIGDSLEASNSYSQSRLAEIGVEVDRLIDEVNAALHGVPERNRVMKCFADLAKLTMLLLTLNPETATNPDYAFKNRLDDFLSSISRPPT